MWFGSDPLQLYMCCVQELLERAAWRVLLRCIKGSEDEELHFLLYAALLQERGPVRDGHALAHTLSKTFACAA